MNTTEERVVRPFDDDPTREADPSCRIHNTAIQIKYGVEPAQRKSVREAAFSGQVSRFGANFVNALTLHAPSARKVGDLRTVRAKARAQLRQEALEGYRAFQAELETLRNLASRFLHKQDELEKTFNALAEQWREETGHLSSTLHKSMHPAYQRIIGLGPQAIPLILRELEQEPNFWFWALRAISGENPTQQADGIEDAIKAWKQWGMKRGYIPSEQR
jgi:hypothetical protein